MTCFTPPPAPHLPISMVDSHRETWPIRSKRFRTWLRRCYYYATGTPPTAAMMASALDLLEARAQFDAPERALSLRYPLLAISGEQGSAKTVLSKLLRALVDPNAAPVRALPREERELMIAANNAHLLAFDNVSGIDAWLSDALCRLASGGSFTVRRLYTDDEEVLFQAARPTLLNGIDDIIGRPDLADRAIFLTLGPIGDEQRRSETELGR